MKENSDGNDTNVGSIENSIEEDIKILEEFKTNGYSVLLMKYGDRIKTNFKLAKAIEHILKELKRFENMYEAEHQIHLVRNEQLARKQQLVIKCNELENENKELKKENEEKTTIILAGAEKVKQLEKENEKQSELIEKVNQYLFNKDMMRDFLKGDKQNERGRKESY